jgi:hypothetical protein
VVKRVGVDPNVLHRRAQVAALTGLARGDDVYAVTGAVAPNYVRGYFTPDVAMLDLAVAVAALDLACPPGTEPLQYEGLRERYPPEVTFRGPTEHRNSQYALYATACMRGGLQPDLARRRRLVAASAVVVRRLRRCHLRPAAAERLTGSLGEIAQRIAARHHLELPQAG